MALPQLLFVAGNPLDLSEEDLKPLVDQVSAASGLSAGVGIVPQRGYGVTWWEVVLIYVGMKGADAVTAHALQLLLDGLTEKTKEWYRRQSLARPNRERVSAQRKVTNRQKVDQRV